MLRHYLIIDGYNLMHACGLARKSYGPGQLRQCRVQLVRHLASHLTRPERERTTIVFDAREAPPDLPRQMTAEGMSVLFALPGREADDAIEELVAAHSAPRQIRLVSGDHRLQKSVRRRRGTFVDSDDFAGELERRGPVNEAPPEPAEQENGSRGRQPAVPETEAEKWLPIFGNISDAAELPSETTHPDVSISQADVAAIEAEIERQEEEKRRRMKGSGGNGPGPVKSKPKSSR
jgi:hypothetical protein